MILVDPPVWQARGRVWSHLASDTSYEELHAFAAAVGLHPRSYDGDHYDVPSERYPEVVAAGAVPTPAREILARVDAAGMRFRKRRGERPLAALVNGLPFLPVPHRLDLIASDREPPERSTVASVTFVVDGRGHVLLLRSRRGAWEGPGGWREDGEEPRATAAREVAEESGVRLRVEDLRPCGYERIHLCAEAPSTPRPLLPTSHIAVYRADVPVAGPTEAVGPEGHALGWFDAAELSVRCAGQPWWPILSVLMERAE